MENDTGQVCDLLNTTIRLLVRVATSLADLQEWSAKHGDALHAEQIHSVSLSIRRDAETLQQELQKVSRS
jgi:hypothetical protein